MKIRGARRVERIVVHIRNQVALTQFSSRLQTVENGKVVPATRSQVIHGVAWLMTFKFVDKAIGVVSTLILARVLTPGDFGLVAMAMAVVAVTQLMSAFGFESALIQRQNAGRAHYDTAWTFNVIFGVCIAVLIAILAWPMALFYEDERLFPVLLVLGIASLVGGFENVGVVAFRKDLNFRSEFNFLLGKRVAGFVVTVGLALWLQSYWALVIGVLIGRLLAVAISFQLHAFRPRLSLAARADLMHFSKWIFLSSLIGVVNGRSTDFILGRTVGAHGLGVYSIAYEISSMTSTELIAPLNRAVYPAYARLGSDPAALRTQFLKIFGVICLLSIPMGVGLFAVSKTAVEVMLGPKWAEAVPLIRIFAFCGLVGAIQSNMYLVNVAQGNPQANTVLLAWLTVLSLPAVIFCSIQFGVVGAAYARLAESAAALVGIVYVFTRLVGVRPRELLAQAWRPVLVSSIMGAVVLWLEAVLLQSAGTWPSPFRLAGLVGVGAFVFCVLEWIVWRLSGSCEGAEAVVIELVVARWRQWFPVKSFRG